MPLTTKPVRILAVVFGGLGVLLCLGGILGVYVVRGAARDTATEGVRAADSIVAGLEDGVRTARALTRRVRADLEVRVGEALVPEIAAEIEGLRTLLRTIGAGARSAAALIDALGPVLDADDLSARLSEAAGEIASVSAELAEVRILDENREAAGDGLGGVGSLLDSVEAELTATRAELTRLRVRVHRIIGLVSLAAAAFLIWMAVGQVFLFRAARG